MSNSINTNISAYFAQANITSASAAANENVARLSSGNAIVEASDNVAALATGTSLATQVGILNTAQTNAAQGSSLLQVADGALAQIQSILQQQESIANQAQSGTLTDTDRGFLNQEFQQLTSEIDALAKGTSFNGVNLIDGSIATGGSNNPLRNASVGTTGANAAFTITGFTATPGGASPGGVNGFTSLVLDVVSSATQNDTAFLGDLSKAVVTGSGTTNNQVHPYSVGLTLNGSVWEGTLAVDATTLALDDGTSTITFSINALSTTVTAAQFATDLQNSFANATGYAIHAVASTLATDSNGNNIAGSAITASSTAGTLLDGFSGANVQISSTLFDGNKLPSISNFSGTGKGVTTAISVQVDGTTYSTSGTVTDGGSTNELAQAEWGGNNEGQIILYANGNSGSNNKITINLGATAGDLPGAAIGAAAKIGTTADVAQVVAALNSAFGSGGGQGGLTFQLGTTSSGNVTVNIANTQSTSLFGGATLDVSTAGDAATAAAAVATALNTVTATRSGVGAYETQFNFATAALQSSVQNQSAAQSQLLDTNIATESTAYATNQVKLQAGISVLAQANQQLQALLKLIG